MNHDNNFFPVTAPPIIPELIDTLINMIDRALPNMTDISNCRNPTTDPISIKKATIKPIFHPDNIAEDTAIHGFTELCELIEFSIISFLQVF